MTDRREFSPKTKTEAFTRARGRCENCGVHIRRGNGPEYDHIIEAFYDGDNSLDNCCVLCRNCHGSKTSDRAPELAKSRRLVKDRAGIKRSKTPMRKPPQGYKYNWSKGRYEKA